MAYEQLPIVEVDLDQLLLDLENYRIPTRRDDEAGALKYLFASEDVLGAARLILRDGYFDNEVPIVTSAAASGGGSRQREGSAGREPGGAATPLTRVSDSRYPFAAARR